MSTNRSLTAANTAASTIRSPIRRTVADATSRPVTSSTDSGDTPALVTSAASGSPAIPRSLTRTPKARSRAAVPPAAGPGGRAAEGVSGPGAQVERLPLAAILDDIRSLWNVGSIFRSADGCGVEKLWLAGITGAPPRAEITRTALGAEEQVAWEYCSDVLEAIEQACSEGYEPVVIEAGETSSSLDDFSWPEKPCLVLGNEATGVSPLVLDACVRRVSIPMCGVKESFNVAVAFGIAAHQAARALAPANPGVVFRG